MSVFTFHWTSSAFLALLALIEHHYFFHTYYNDTLEDNMEYFSSFLLLHWQISKQEKQLISPPKL